MNIVLVHGVLGFSHLDSPLGRIEYFAGVADHLRQRFQATVFAPALDPTEGTEVRSGQLRAAISGAIGAGQLNATDPIHIIAHSLGGLDARRMIAQDSTVDGVPIKALAMISTPHRGSPIADVISAKVLPLIPGVALQGVLDHFKLSMNSLHDLTSECAGEFNVKYPDVEGVQYTSYAGRGRDGFPQTALFFLPYYTYIRAHTGEDNDGMVPVSSARWTGFDENLWPCDHADEIGHDLNFPLGKIHPEALQRFDEIVQRFA